MRIKNSVIYYVKPDKGESDSNSERYFYLAMKDYSLQIEVSMERLEEIKKKYEKYKDTNGSLVVEYDAPWSWCEYDKKKVVFISYCNNEELEGQETDMWMLDPYTDPICRC